MSESLYSLKTCRADKRRVISVLFTQISCSFTPLQVDSRIEHMRSCPVHFTPLKFSCYTTSSMKWNAGSVSHDDALSLDKFYILLPLHRTQVLFLFDVLSLDFGGGAKLDESGKISSSIVPPKMDWHACTYIYIYVYIDKAVHWLQQARVTINARARLRRRNWGRYLCHERCSPVQLL